MTYQEKFDELKKDFALASDKYIKTNKELSEINGFFDSSLLEEFSKAKNEFEITGNNYHSFLTIAKNNNAKPNDLYP